MYRLRFALAAAALTTGISLVTGAGAAFAAPASSTALVAWGDNLFGSAGVGSTTEQLTTPNNFALPGGRTVASLYSGGQNGAAIATDGTVWSWGSNEAGQLGTGSVTPSDSISPVQVAVPSGVSFAKLSLGSDLMFAIDSNGNVWAWGDDGAGQLGDGVLGGSQNPTPQEVHLPQGVTISQVAAGSHSGTALTTTGEVYTWGANEVGELGNGDPTGNGDANPTPALVDLSNAPIGTTFTSIQMASNSVSAESTTGVNYVWGDNFFGQLLLPDQTAQFEVTPTVIDDSADPFSRLYLGSQFSLGMGANGTLYGWGLNADGELGNGTTDQNGAQLSPVAVGVPSGVTFTSIHVGFAATYATTADGDIYAWGNGEVGLLGNGATDDVLSPTVVPLSTQYQVQLLNYTNMTIYAQVTGTIPQITTTSLPAAMDGNAYSASIAATGSTPITYSVSAGTLPAGLTLDPSTGAITGTPTVNGSFSFTITASNLVGSSSQPYVLAIAAGGASADTGGTLVSAAGATAGPWVAITALGLLLAGAATATWLRRRRPKRI